MGLNKILKFLIYYDLLALSSFGLIQPVFALFLEREIAGVTTATVGIAAAIFLITKATIQPFIGKIADREIGNHREIKFLFLSSLLMVITPIMYILSKNIYHIYFAQFVFGIGSAFSWAAWYTLFTRSVDKNKEGYQWSVYDSVMGLAGAATAFVGAVIAQYFGFNAVFVLISILSGSSLIIAVFLKKYAVKEVLQS